MSKGASRDRHQHVVVFLRAGVHLDFRLAPTREAAFATSKE